MKFRFKLYEKLILDESAKTDFIAKFGQDRLNNFDKARQRMKNNNLSVDYQSYLKMSPEELDNFILSLYDRDTDAQKRRVLQGTDKDIRGKYNYLGRYGDYEVYEPLDYISSMDLGINTGWCTTGRYGHYGHPEFTPSEAKAKKHFNDYTNKGIRLIYLLDPQTMYGEIAIAVYPQAPNVDRRVYQRNKIIYLKSANFKIFNAEDENDYGLLNKIPKQLIDKLNLRADCDVVTDFSQAKEINIKKSDKISCDLLSIEEVEKIPREIRRYSFWWWLRSPGCNSDYATLVISDGSVDLYGHYVISSIDCVRPALHISNLDSLNLEIYKDIIKVFDKYWIYIGDNEALLMSKPLAQMAFNIDEHKGNNYETSDIKAFLDNWLEEQRERK